MVHTEGLSPDTVNKIRKEGTLVLDTRRPKRFAEHFISGAYNVEYGERFIEIIKDFILPDRSLVIVADEGEEENVISKLNELGYSNIKGYLQGGMQNWLESGKPLDLTISISAYEFSLDVKHDKSIQLFDLREKEDFEHKHIKGSENKDFHELIADRALFEANTTYYIICEDGARSMALISFLKANDVHNLYHVNMGILGLEDEDVDFVENKKNSRQK